MESLVDACISRKIPDVVVGELEGCEFKVVNFSNLGEVLMKNDGFYGVVVCNEEILEDFGPYSLSHIRYMTYVPLVLYLMQADPSTLDSVELTSSLFKELHMEFGFDFASWHEHNVTYLSKLTLIWMCPVNDYNGQVPAPTSSIVVFRSNYNYFMSNGVQNSSYRSYCCS